MAGMRFVSHGIVLPSLLLARYRVAFDTIFLATRLRHTAFVSLAFRVGVYLFCLLDIYPWGAARYTLLLAEQGSGCCAPLPFAVRLTCSQCSFVAAQSQTLDYLLSL